MKYLKILNTLAIGIPIMILVTYPIFKDGALFWGLFSMMLTGLIQVIVGLILLLKDPRNCYFISYILIVILFFGLGYFNMNVYYSDFLTFLLFPIPLLLAIYLSILIYKRERL